MINPNIEFDVAYDFSLDTIRDEVLPLLKNPDSGMLINPCGPAGGNTQVLVYAADELDMLRVCEYMKQHGLGLFIST